MKKFNYVAWFVTDPFDNEPWSFKGRVTAEDTNEAYKKAEKDFDNKLGDAAFSQLMNWYVKEVK